MVYYMVAERSVSRWRFIER